MLEDLPPLRDSLAVHGLLANKAFGQHFLLDLNVTRKIARLAGPLAGETVIEVGPGPGGLTRALLEAGAQVIAVEKDPRFVPLLTELGEAAGGGALTVMQADALHADEAALLGGRRGNVVSNLPYNVGTPLLIKWLTGAWRPASMTLMFQKEVADRIAAPVGDDAYGRLSVIAQAICAARVVMDLPAKAFTPPPKVASAVVRLDPHPDALDPALIRRLERVTAAAFGQRRKMLRASLKPVGGEALCRAAGIEPDARAETIDVAGFLRLAQALGAGMSMASLAIREIGDADVAQVVELWIASGITRPWNDPLVDIAFARKSPQSVVLVGLTEGRIVATVMVGEDGHRGWVYYVATHPEVQRRGFARAMMGAAEAWLRDRGIWKMQLLVRGDNASAKGFYERLGYADTRTVCFQKVISGDPAAGDAR